MFGLTIWGPTQTGKNLYESKSRDTLKKSQPPGKPDSWLDCLLDFRSFYDRFGGKTVIVAHSHHGLLDLGPLVLPDVLDEGGRTTLGKTHAMLIPKFGICTR